MNSKLGWCGSDGSMGDAGPGDPPDSDPPFPASQAITCDLCGGDGGQAHDDFSWEECPRCEGYGVIRKDQWVQDGKIWP